MRKWKMPKPARKDFDGRCAASRTEPHLSVGHWNRLAVVVFAGAVLAAAGACANPPTGKPTRAEAPPRTQPPSPSPTTVAERDFPTAAIVLDDRGAPKKVWLVSSPSQGTAQALEFFSGERVADVRVEPSGSSAPGKGWSYSFTDRSGRRYAAIRPLPSQVDTDQPSAYAGWDGKDGTGHEVVLGATAWPR